MQLLYSAPMQTLFSRLSGLVLSVRVLALVALLATSAQAGALVRLDYANFGSVYIDLFDNLTPTTASNFLQYVNKGTYNNTIIHRVDTGVGVIQGGGFDQKANAITNFGNIPLEYSRANTRGTISMARYYDQANPSNTTTGSSQWFINTKDNTASLGQANNGGYAVFGWIVGSSMSVVDNIAAVPTFAYSSPFGQVPLQNFTQADFTNKADPLPHTVVLTSATLVSNSQFDYQNPFINADVNNDGAITPLDLARVVNDIIAKGIHNFNDPFAGTDYLDPSGDGKMSPADVAKVVNALILQDSQSATSAVPLAMNLSQVPEPSSLAIATTALTALAAYGYRRRSRRNR